MLNVLLKIFTLIGLILLLPIIAISAILILLEDGKPVFFIQKRIGKDLKVFNIYKLRTMYKNTPSLGTHEVDKSNYLKIGSILRLTKIDELPQLINLIKGELLLIGPRPGLNTQLKLKDERLKRGVFSIVPGISGLGQVLGYDMSDPIKLSKIDLKQIEILEELLVYSKKNEIKLIGYFPPFAPSVNKMMNNPKYDYSYIKESSNLILQLFDEYGFKFKDFTNIDYYDDSFYLDGFHCNRNIYYYILRELKIPVNKNFDNTFNLSKEDASFLNQYF